MIIDANGKRPFEIRDSTGKEFKTIYDADGNLLFKNWNTIQGTPPIVFKGYNKALKNYKIYGNTIQDGTPTPETPVEVQGCGEYDAGLNGYKIPVTISNGVFLNEPLRGIGEYKDTLDLSTGIVTRRIKKLVLTGAEDWSLATNKRICRIILNDYLKENGTIVTMSSHYAGGPSVAAVSLASVPDLTCTCLASESESKYFYIRDDSFMSIQGDEAARVNTFTDYLSAQYEAGTPVTVYYVLAEPETKTVSIPSGLSGIIEGYCIQDETPTPDAPVEIVSNGDLQLDGTYLVPGGSTCITTPVYIGSEPLHKIGDYADYIDFERGVVVRNIKKIVLTGDESWIDNVHNENQNVYRLENFINFRRFPNPNDAGSTIGIYRCDHILYMYPYPLGLYDRIVLLNNYTYPYTIYFSTKKSMGIDTVTSFKNFLAEQYELGQPVTIWYIAAEPEEEPLENLSPIQTIKGVNILSANTTIQPSEIYLKGKIKSLATHTG